MSIPVEFVRPATTRGFGVEAEPVPEFRFYGLCEQVPAAGDSVAVAKDVANAVLHEMTVSRVIWLMEDLDVQQHGTARLHTVLPTSARVILR